MCLLRLMMGCTSHILKCILKWLSHSTLKTHYGKWEFFFFLSIVCILYSVCGFRLTSYNAIKTNVCESQCWSQKVLWSFRSKHVWVWQRLQWEILLQVYWMSILTNDQERAEEQLYYLRNFGNRINASTGVQWRVKYPAALLCGFIILHCTAHNKK